MTQEDPTTLPIEQQLKELRDRVENVELDVLDNKRITAMLMEYANRQAEFSGLTSEQFGRLGLMAAIFVDKQFGSPGEAMAYFEQIAEDPKAPKQFAAAAKRLVEDYAILRGDGERLEWLPAESGSSD